MGNKKIVLILILVVLISGCAEKAEIKPVKIDGTDFVMDNKTFKFIGANAGSLLVYDESGLSVDKGIRTAKESGINVLRIFLFGNRFEGPFSGPYVEWPKISEDEAVVMKSNFKDYLGVYNEYYFKQVDAILDTASKYDVYIIITLREHHWEDDVYWHTNAGKEGMFTDPELIEAFKNFITHTLTRRNTINGKIYKDDPTILAWDIMNEPYASTPSALPDWLNIITTHIHSLDTNHPVTVGLETDSSIWDEYGFWYEIINVTGIDFFSFHFYPESREGNGTILPYNYWQPPYGNPNPNPTVTKKAISFRTETFLSFGKPVVMEEFGFSSRFGQTELLKVYRNSMDAAFDAGASGAVFWHWGLPQAKKRFDSWGLDDHTYTEKEFVAMLKEYADKINK